MDASEARIQNSFRQRRGYQLAAQFQALMPLLEHLCQAYIERIVDL